MYTRRFLLTALVALTTVNALDACQQARIDSLLSVIEYSDPITTPVVIVQDVWASWVFLPRPLLNRPIFRPRPVRTTELLLWPRPVITVPCAPAG